MKIDILFVVDNSYSMDSIQQNIIRNASLFMKAFLKQSTSRWKMGVISTDKNDAPYLGFDSTFDLQLGLKNPSRAVDLFSQAIRDLGVYGSANEYVFYNILRVMTDKVDNYELFFRKDAHLAVIMVTDEKEQSLQDFGASYAPNGFLNTLRGMKDTDKIIRFYGAFNFRDLEQCQPGFGSIKYVNSAFKKVIEDTGGIHMSACTVDFGKNLAAIGEDILTIGNPPKVLLEERPVVESIRVIHEGKVIPGGPQSDGGKWFYSPKFSSITFYDMEFVDDIENGKLQITYDIEDGIDRRE